MLCSVSNSGHDGSRRGENKSAWTENDQDGDRADNLSCQNPGDSRCTEGNHNDPCGPAIRYADNFCFSGIGRLDETDHPLNGTVLSHLCGIHIKGSELVNRTAGYFIACAFVHRERFSGHDSLVDGSLTGMNDSVDRNGLSGQDAQQIANLYRFCRYNFFLLPGYPTCRAGSEMNQLLDSLSGLGHSQIFQQSSQLHDESDFSGSKGFTDDDRRNQSDGYEHVCLDIQFRHKSDHRFQNDRDAAKKNGDPGHIEGKGRKTEDTCEQRKPGENKKDDVPLYAAPFQ